MCDCYGHKCCMCDELVPMHIADFAYPREDFTVWCDKHVSFASSGAVIFEITGPLVDDEEESYPLGWKCAILGPSVGEEGGNHPNICENWKETRVAG